jgi:hypothetical protein
MVDSGTIAGEPESCWTRRAKIPLVGITWALIANAAPGAFIEARIAGTGARRRACLRDRAPSRKRLEGFDELTLDDQ